LFIVVNSEKGNGEWLARFEMVGLEFGELWWIVRDEWVCVGLVAE